MSKIVSETEKTLNNMIISAIDKAVSTGALPDAEKPEFIIEKPADKKNGDFSTNAAMAGARSYHKAPRMIAEAIYDWWRSKKPFKQWFAETYQQGTLDFGEDV